MKDKCIMCNTTNTDGCYSIQGQTVCKDCGKKYSLEEIKKMITKMNSKLTNTNKVNESKLDNNILDDILDYMVTECDLKVYSDGTAEVTYIPDLDDIQSYVYEDATQEDVDKISKQVEDLITNAKFYRENGELYIQLNDNHTLFDIDNDNVDEQLYNELLEPYFDAFEQDTGVQLYQAGRSGRHIVVKFNLDNLENYNTLKSEQEQLEQTFIEEVNNYGKEEESKDIKMNSKLTDKNKVNESRLGNNTFTDEDEAEYYRNKELYAHSGLARHKEAMEKAKQACKEKGIDVDETKGVYESKQLNEEYSEELGGDPEDFVSDLKDILNKLNEIDTSDLESHKAEEILSNLIDECNNKIKQVTSKYNLKESKTEVEPLNLQPDNTEIKQPKDLIGKYVKIGVNYYPVFDVKSEGDKFVICYAAAGPMVKGGEFEPATIDQIKNLQLYVDTNKVVQESKKLQERDTSKEAILDSVNNKIVPELEWVAEFGKDAGLYGLAELCEEYANTLRNTKIEESDKVDAEKFVKDTGRMKKLGLWDGKDNTYADAKKKLDKIDKINKDLDESKKVTEKKDTPELVQKAKDWKKRVTASKDEDELEEIVEEIMDEVKDLSETNWAAEDLYSEAEDVMDDQDALDRGPATYIRSVKTNFKNILTDFINNYADACADAELDESKKVQESKTLTESDNSDVDVDTDPIIYMNTWKNYNEYGADLTMYGDIEGWMTVEDARNFAEEHEEDEPFINDINVDLPFEVNEYSNVMDALDNIEEYLNLDEDDRNIIDCIMEVQTGDINEALDTFRQDNYMSLPDVSNEYDLGYEYVQYFDFPTNIMTYFDEDKFKESIRDDVYNMYLDDNNLQDVEDEEAFESYLDEIVQEDVYTFEEDVENNKDTIKEYFDYEYFGRDLTMSGWTICEDKNIAIYIY